MNKSLILALSAAFVFNAASVSEAAPASLEISHPISSSVEVQDLDEDYSPPPPPPGHRPPPPPPEYRPEPAPPFLTDKQKKEWRKQEMEREEWYDEARTRWRKANPPPPPPPPPHRNR